MTPSESSSRSALKSFSSSTYCILSLILCPLVEMTAAIVGNSGLVSTFFSTLLLPGLVNNNGHAKLSFLNYLLPVHFPLMFWPQKCSDPPCLNPLNSVSVCGYCSMYNLLEESHLILRRWLVQDLPLRQQSEENTSVHLNSLSSASEQ